MSTDKDTELTRPLLFLLTLGAAVCVSSLYYTQPMLGMIRAEFNASVDRVSLIPSLTQIGYAVGLFCLAPLGDRYNRKTIILVKLVGLFIALFLSYVSTSVEVLIFTSFVMGIVATVAQDFVPAVAILSPEATRGKNLGIIMTGVMLGILLSRVLSGFISGSFGWRAVFVFALSSIALLFVVTLKALPDFKSTTQFAYRKLISSLFELIAKHRTLRIVTLSQALLGLGFSAFWSTLAIVLQDRFALGSAAAGAFGLAGAAGAAAALIGGRLSDRFGSTIVSFAGSFIALISFALLFFLGSVTQDNGMLILIVCAVGFDLGIQGTLVAHQTIIYGLDANARSRLNAIFATGIFLGMASGSVLGGLFYSYFGTVGLAMVMSLSCLLSIGLKLNAGRARG